MVASSEMVSRWKNFLHKAVFHKLLVMHIGDTKKFKPENCT